MKPDYPYIHNVQRSWPYKEELKICEFYRICKMECKFTSPTMSSSNEYYCGLIHPLNKGPSCVQLLVVNSALKFQMLKAVNKKYEK